ncbi:hypothetical protein ACHQM5_021036 [Ranunculus cassubicifolius]
MVAATAPLSFPFKLLSPLTSPSTIKIFNSHLNLSTKPQIHHNKSTFFSAAFHQTPCEHNSKTNNHIHTSPQSIQLTDSGILFSVFQDIGFDEQETQIILDKYPDLQLVSVESIYSRIQSLRSVGIHGVALYRVIVKSPEVLIAEEVQSLLSYVQKDLKEEIELSKLQRVLASTEPRLFAGFAEKVRLLVEHGVPEEKVVYVLNNVNISKAFCCKSVEEVERTIVYLKRFGGYELIVRRPGLLNFDLNNQLIPRVGFLLELSGGDEDATGVVLRKLPAILTYTDDHMRSHVEFLRSFAGLTEPEIFKIVLVYPNIASVSRERKLHPRVDFLKQCGLNPNDIFRFLIKAPLFLSLSFRDNLSKKLAFLMKIGYENGSKELAIAMGAVTRTSCENMQMVIDIFLNYGLSCEDILAMSKKHPQVLQYNHKSLEKKMEYLIEDIGRDIGELLAFPAFLGYKLDDRIKHRYELKKEITGEGMSLNKLLSVSTERFSKKNKAEKVKQDRK